LGHHGIDDGGPNQYIRVTINPQLLKIHLSHLGMIMMRCSDCLNKASFSGIVPGDATEAFPIPFLGFLVGHQSPGETWLLFSKKERWIVNNSGVMLIDPYPRGRTSIIYTVAICQNHASHLPLCPHFNND